METKRFIAGVATGTIREFGVSPDTGDVNVFNRTAISPAISKASDEVLDVSYRLTLWPELNDLNGTVTIDGETYDTITRGLNIGQNANDIFSYPGPRSSGWAASESNLITCQ